MQNGKTWILITDVCKARLFAVVKAKLMVDPKIEDFELIGEYLHEKSKEFDHELVTDRSGQFAGSAFVPQTEPKKHEAEVFVHELVQHLEKGRKDGKFRDVVLVAPSAVMGLINKVMNHELERMVVQRIEKDYTHYDGRELMKRLVEHF